MVRPHDIDRRAWEKAKREARVIMIATAQSAKGTITYNELASRITGLRLEPDSLALRELLGEISAAEDMAGRGMLSVVVVHQGEDCLPGHGFFTLAQGFGETQATRKSFGPPNSQECGKFGRRLSPKIEERSVTDLSLWLDLLVTVGYVLRWD
jgi:hypothetical protein